MKIGLIIYGSLETLSGGYLYDRRLVATLRQAGHQVEILSLPWRNYPSHLFDNALLPWAQEIVQRHFDLLLQDELNHPSLFLLNGYLRSVGSCPIISIVHHLRSEESHPQYWMPLYRQIERHYLRSVDAFIYNSRTTQAIVEAHLEYVAPHVVAYPAADHRDIPSHAAILEKVAQMAKSDEPLQLLFVGNIIPRKGLHTVLDALAQTRLREWHLHIVGSEDLDASYTGKLRSKTHALGIASYVTWHGRISDSALAHRLMQSDALVMPSYEGFGIVYLEAMAYGLPVLAAQVGAAPEIVTNAVNGYLVPYNSASPLSALVDRIQSNRSHLATLAYFARQHFENHPTWDESMRLVEQWLQRIASQHTSRTT